jgi:hypothetical protein
MKQRYTIYGRKGEMEMKYRRDGLEEQEGKKEINTGRMSIRDIWKIGGMEGRRKMEI